MLEFSMELWNVPAGNLTVCYGKSRCLIGKSTINGPCLIAMLNYQRVSEAFSQLPSSAPGVPGAAFFRRPRRACGIPDGWYLMVFVNRCLSNKNGDTIPKTNKIIGKSIKGYGNLTKSGKSTGEWLANGYSR